VQTQHNSRTTIGFALGHPPASAGVDPTCKLTAHHRYELALDWRIDMILRISHFLQN